VSLRPYLEFATQTAYEAGRLTLGYFGTEAARPEFKADDTPVTVADREAERLIRGRIEARYPEHAVLGEEFGETGGLGSEHLWILDPIDGTKSFVRGVPLYGVLIGLQISGVCEVGAAYFPALDEMVCAATSRVSPRPPASGSTAAVRHGNACSPPPAAPAAGPTPTDTPSWPREEPSSCSTPS
jgi:histidinol-phosphatase